MLSKHEAHSAKPCLSSDKMKACSSAGSQLAYLSIHVTDLAFTEKVSTSAREGRVHCPTMCLDDLVREQTQNFYDITIFTSHEETKSLK